MVKVSFIIEKKKKKLNLKTIMANYVWVKLIAMSFLDAITTIESSQRAITPVYNKGQI